MNETKTCKSCKVWLAQHITPLSCHVSFYTRATRRASAAWPLNFVALLFFFAAFLNGSLWIIVTRPVGTLFCLIARGISCLKLEVSRVNLPLLLPPFKQHVECLIKKKKERSVLPSCRHRINWINPKQNNLSHVSGVRGGAVMKRPNWATGLSEQMNNQMKGREDFSICAKEKPRTSLSTFIVNEIHHA